MGRRGVDPRLVVTEERHPAARALPARLVGGAAGQRGRAEGGRPERRRPEEGPPPEPGRACSGGVVAAHTGQPLRPSTPGMRASFSDRSASSACMRVLSTAWRAVYEVEAAVGVGVLGQALVDGCEPGRDLGGQRGVLGLQGRGEQLEQLPGAVDVGGEVRQVGVRVAVLLAGDLALGDLLDELGRAEGDRRRRELEALHLLVEGGQVLVQPVGEGLGAGGRALLPQVVLEPVPAGERGVVDALEVVDPGVDGAVDLLDQAGDGLDPLPADPAGGVLLLGLGHVPGPDRVGELGRVGDQPVDLGHDPGLVVGHRLEDQLVVGGAAQVLPGQPRPGPGARPRPGARPAGRALTADPCPVVLPAPGQQQHGPEPERGDHPPDPAGPRLDPTRLTPCKLSSSRAVGAPGPNF